MIAGFASKTLNTLPAVHPVTSATLPQLFQTIVKYSSLEPPSRHRGAIQGCGSVHFQGLLRKGVEAGVNVVWR
jgi:hypothetical protein